MQSDPDFEYIAQPKQKRLRLRNNVLYNEFGMRNEALKDSCVKILGFGDSVINGGTLTNQDDLATRKLSESLSESLDTCVQVLNISAGSWGPDNAAAYLKKYGNFNASLIFLVANSHDAHDNMTFDPVVGVYPDFPDRQYAFALHELLDRYIFPYFFKARYNQNVSSGINKNGKGFNQGFKMLSEHAKRENIPFIIYLHPEISELTKGKYNDQGQEIIRFAEKNNIRIIKALDYQLQENEYRDQIHINEAGQEHLSETIEPVILDLIQNKVTSAN